ncbi:hypothetical protein ACFOMD_12000 [Sphingoaurantiacus capsulatus]|uniref:DUF2157 domain-containing protein n=1 Tax=Sphingoaurantiacus capsulatus TaxID=1771310 RepID=A0ABV7XBM5_9SPHN
MIEKADLDAAIAANVMSEAQGAALTEFVRQRHQVAMGADEEHIRFITSFNDIFVTIAAVLLLVAVGALGQRVDTWFSALGVAVAAWGLAEYFTRQRKMALPSILLLLAFVGGVFVTLGAAIVKITGVDNVQPDTPQGAVYLGIAGAGAVAAAIAHWRRFQVPITVAAGAAALSAIAFAIVASIMGEDRNALLTAVSLSGVGVFVVAMRYDMSDRQRVTRRTDIAFWLHLLAAPMIIHPLVVMFGVNGPGMAAAEAVAIVAVYLIITVVALAIDRRALLVSGLAYMIFALQTLFKETGDVDLGFALTCLVIGLFLVTLSAAWQRIRAVVMPLVPRDLAERLPVVA